jgi:hypothetical protein
MAIASAMSATGTHLGIGPLLSLFALRGKYDTKRDIECRSVYLGADRGGHSVE